MFNKNFGYIFMSILFSATALDASESSKTDGKESKNAKIAFVNIQRIITTEDGLLNDAAEEWKELFKKLKKTLEPIDKELKELQEKGTKAGNEFESLQKSSLANKEALQRKYEEVARLEMQFRQGIQDREKLVQKELNDANSKVAPKVEKVIDKLRSEQGWDLILRGEVVISASKGFDLTNEVLTRLNKDYTAEKKAKEAKAKK